MATSFPLPARLAGALLCAALLGGPCLAAAGKRDAAPPPAPEQMLVEIRKDLAANNLRAAQQRADALVEAYPNFRLGHLLRGDLLMMHTRAVTQLGAASGATPDAQAKLQDLRHEAMVRLNAGLTRPAATALPRALLQMRSDQRHALVVDARNSRVYLYQNRNGQLRLIDDFYFSQGKLGVNKLKEGDLRTPVGVYYIVSRLSGAKLPDFYGKGALPLDFPNDWDRHNGRSGSGIWIHGTPPDTFSRPPLATDGCVVLSNDDLARVSAIVEVGKTPVLIGDQVEFASAAVVDGDRKLAEGLLEGWRRDAELRGGSELLAHYGARFRSSSDEDAATWLARQQFLPGAKKVRVTLRDVTHFRQPSKEDVIISTFTQQTTVGKFRHVVRLRQYWARDGRQWKIMSETLL